jgi:hypothetical protein
MPDVPVKDVIEYLAEPRTRAELREHFSLSNTQSWHLVCWLKKARLISTVERVVNGNVCEVHRATKLALEESRA